MNRVRFRHRDVTYCGRIIERGKRWVEIEISSGVTMIVGKDAILS